jgi:hypothetical protein
MCCAWTVDEKGVSERLAGMNVNCMPSFVGLGDEKVGLLKCGADLLDRADRKRSTVIRRQTEPLRRPAGWGDAHQSVAY